MCGIFFALYDSPGADLSVSPADFALLKKRGPDSFKTLELNLENNKSGLFAASVLSLRAGLDKSTQQPLHEPSSGNVLLWNGELFASDLISVGPDENDGQNIFKLLCQETLAEPFNESLIFTVFESIKGPYAFLFYLKKTNTIYFGRDRFGRRSLLINTSNHGQNQLPSVIISSVQIKLETEDFNNEYEELKANYIYKLDLNESPIFVEAFEWKQSGEVRNDPNSTNETKLFSKISFKISETFLNDSIISFNESADQSEIALADYQQVLDEFFDKLKEGVMRRVKNMPKLCKRCTSLKRQSKFQSDPCEHAKVAVLFSGGVDSTVLAALADLCMPAHEPIDLLNIAFEKPNKSGVVGGKVDDFMVPDRVSGLKSLSELNPARRWNFVEINITLDELRKERDGVIRHLLYPHQTVLDDSIGCALWFASRGKGFIKVSESDRMEYTSYAEILLLGMGADEQLAGYARHRTRFENYGMDALIAEVKMEMKRISERNLGRDDRILSDHGKESRLPFLDEDLISFLNSIEMRYKCDMKLARGFGEKSLLRKLAAQKLNLNFSANLQKRAIQFGSRVAKIENSKEKASDFCNRLKDNLLIED